MAARGARIVFLVTYWPELALFVIEVRSIQSTEVQ